MFLDTNVASHACDSGDKPQSDGLSISSVVASELLGVYDQKPTSARFYVPLAARIGRTEAETGRTHVGSIASLRRRDHPFGKRLTDIIVMEFGTIHRPIVEFGSQALADLINERRGELFTTTIQHLPKSRRKAAKRRFTWLLDANAKCHAISDDVLTTAYSMLRFFARSYSFKANFRNTWNDMLIAATARVHREPLLTEDKLLQRVLAAAGRVPHQPAFGNLLADYSATEQQPSHRQEKGDRFHRPWRHRLAGGKWTRSMA